MISLLLKTLAFVAFYIQNFSSQQNIEPLHFSISTLIPAELPSTRYNSLFVGSLERQSLNLEANPNVSRGLLREASLAFLAAILARDDSKALFIISFPVSGFSSKYCSN